MQPTFDMINSTNALCTYIASNTIAFGPGTKPATVEKTMKQITPKIGASSDPKESDALPKRDQRSTAHASDHDRRSDHGDTSPEWKVCSKTGSENQFKKPLEDTNRNKASQDHGGRRTSKRKDAFTTTNDLVLGSRTDHLAGPPLHDDGIEIGATTDTIPLNRDNRQDGTSSNVATSLIDDLGLADYQYKEEIQKPLFRNIDMSLRLDHPSRDSTTTVAEGRSSLRQSITSQTPRARNPTELSNSVDPVLNLDSTSSNPPLEPSPAEKPGCENPETRHH
jgi:hypothetical protein